VDTIGSGPSARPSRWVRLSRQLGAYGVTATLGLGALGAVANQCDPDDPPSQREQVVQITNQRRADNGLEPLRADSRLNLAAQRHSADQARLDRMSHVGSDGSTFVVRISRTGYPFSTGGENVAAGYPNAKQVMRGWMNSAGHRANILNRDVTEIGVGAVRSSDGTLYWTMVLARPG